VKILILGAGRVGSTVAENLISEQNDISVIDADEAPLRYLKIVSIYTPYAVTPHIPLY
jgi:trk system potassium uptake protein TrkA